MLAGVLAVAGTGRSVAGLKIQKLRQNMREGLDSGPSTKFDLQEIKRAAA